LSQIHIFLTICIRMLHSFMSHNTFLLWLSLTNHINSDILFIITFLPFFLILVKGVRCFVFIYIYMYFISKRKVEISFVFVFYMSICFSTNILDSFFFYFPLYITICFYTREWFNLSINWWEKNSISYASPCSFALGSVNCRILLMMKLICYRFFFYYSLHLAIFIIVIRC